MPMLTKSHEEMLSDLKAFWESRRSSDVILLVHDRTIVENAMKDAGIDTRVLRDELHDLLGPSSSRPPPSSYGNRGRNGMQDYDVKNRRRSRSRSPRRGQPGGSVRKRSSSPSPPQSVFVVEVEKLYETLDVQCRKPKLSLHQVAKVFDVSVNPDTICAGDDC